MKQLHRSDLFSWSVFDEERNIDFNSILWQRKEGNLLFDPLPLSDHDEKHLKMLGGASWIIISNSDHIRDTEKIAKRTGAKVAGPAQEKESFSISCQHWLKAGDQTFPGLEVFELDGSKTPGELAFILDETILITGDLLRAHRAASLMLIPDGKLEDPKQARNSARRFLDFPKIETVLVGDGWPVFNDGHAKLVDLLK